MGKLSNDISAAELAAKGLIVKQESWVTSHLQPLLIGLAVGLLVGALIGHAI
jgi:hypothetical protein